MPRNRRGISSRGRMLSRCLQLVRRLEGLRHGVDIYTLSEELGVSTRTIRRDLHAIEEAGGMLQRHGRDGSLRTFHGLEWSR